MVRTSSVSPGEEAALLAAARLGAEDAFRVLYQGQIRYVRGIARAMLRTTHVGDVEDVCQDVFLRAFTRLPQFAEACTFRTWISRITVHTCLEVVRQFGQESNGGCHLVPLHPKMAAEDAALIRLPARIDLEHILRGVTPLQRQMLEMAYVEDMPAAEMAAALGASVVQVKSRLRVAKRRARKNS